MHRCNVLLPGFFPGLCPDLCLACLACLACLERSGRINASVSCPTLRFAHTSQKPLQICFKIASFGHLSVRIWIRPFSIPETQSQSYSRFARHRGIRISKTIADLFPDGFIWTPFRPDLDQAILGTRDTIPRRWQICFQKASFGHLFRRDLD